MKRETWWVKREGRGNAECGVGWSAEIAGKVEPLAGSGRTQAVTAAFEGLATRTLSADLVLMDISMPGLDGLEATRRITAESLQVRVIILSSHDKATGYKAALAAGAAGYLTKGQSPQALAAAIQKVFRGS